MKICSLGCWRERGRGGRGRIFFKENRLITNQRVVARLSKMTIVLNSILLGFYKYTFFFLRKTYSKELLNRFAETFMFKIFVKCRNICFRFGYFIAYDEMHSVHFSVLEFYIIFFFFIYYFCVKRNKFIHFFPKFLSHFKDA